MSLAISLAMSSAAAQMAAGRMAAAGQPAAEDRAAKNRHYKMHCRVEVADEADERHQGRGGGRYRAAHLIAPAHARAPPPPDALFALLAPLDVL